MVWRGLVCLHLHWSVVMQANIWWDCCFRIMPWLLSLLSLQWLLLLKDISRKMKLPFLIDGKHFIHRETQSQSKTRKNLGYNICDVTYFRRDEAWGVFDHNRHTEQVRVFLLSYHTISFVLEQLHNKGTAPWGVSTPDSTFGCGAHRLSKSFETLTVIFLN